MREGDVDDPYEQDGPYRIPVRSVRRHIDPYRDDVWNLGEPITRREVRDYVQRGDLSTTPNSWTVRRERDQEQNRCYDLARVAYLVVNPAKDPISLDIVAPGDIRIDDGCHRLAAAIFRGDDTIGVTYGGWVEEFHRTFRKKELVRVP